MYLLNRLSMITSMRRDDDLQLRRMRMLKDKLPKLLDELTDGHDDSFQQENVAAGSPHARGYTFDTL